MKKISVIIPCYNVERYIDRCLETVVRQTIGMENIEIICVDDCSTDGTYQKLLDWEEKYPENFIVVASEQNGRQGQARNIGLTYASTDWIAFLDSDDWIDLDYLEAMYAFAKTGKYEVVCCSHVRDSSKQANFTPVESKEYPHREILIDTEEKRKQLILNPVFGYSAWKKLIYKPLLVEHEILFPVNVTYEDAFWGSIFHLYVKTGVLLDAPLYHYFINEQSTVLKTNLMHHLDCITVQDMLWEEWKKRGFLDKYPEELQMEHIYSAFLPGIKMLILRFEEPNYNGYLLLRHLSLKKIPDYEKNPYIQKGILKEEHRLALVALKNQLNKKQFLEFAEQLKKIGI